MLGLGEGGYAFFGKIQLAIGWPNGAVDLQEYAIDWATPLNSIWGMPYDITLKESLALYLKPGACRIIFMEKVPGNVTIFGHYLTDHRYANLLQEASKYTLWGFNDGPGKMTETGRRLFTNTVFRSIP